MKVLVTGIDGMIGHKIAQSLSENFTILGLTRKKIKPRNLGLNKCQLITHDFLTDNIESLILL